MLNVETVSKAIEQGGSIRAAAKLLGKSYTSVQWWMARNGYRIQRKSVLVKISQKKGN